MARHDLSSDAHWQQIHSDMQKNCYAAVFMGTPCETASRARTGPPGPRPLRSAEHIYGLPKSQLSAQEWDQVQLGTYFALKSAQTAELASTLSIPWAIENPDPTGNPVSLYNLPEWKALLDIPGTKFIDFHQCPMGAETAKPTRILYWGCDMSQLAGKCDHPPQWWNFSDFKNQPKSVWSPHPPLVGRKRDNSFASKASAAYPATMNWRIAQALVNGKALDPFCRPFPREAETH